MPFEGAALEFNLALRRQLMPDSEIVVDGCCVTGVILIHFSAVSPLSGAEIDRACGPDRSPARTPRPEVLLTLRQMLSDVRGTRHHEGTRRATSSRCAAVVLEW